MGNLIDCNGPEPLPHGEQKNGVPASPGVKKVASSSSTAAAIPTLDPARWLSFTLIEKVELSPDTRLFRFALPSSAHCLGLPIGKHVWMRFTPPGGGEDDVVQRSYTPTSSDSDLGTVDFVIKVYFAGVHPKFPAGGQLTQHLESLPIGAAVEMRGPKGRLSYAGRGRIEIEEYGEPTPDVRTVQRIGMIAGGTGITPMLQIIRAVFADPEDTTELALIFANKSVDDILLRKELEILVAAQPERFRLHFTLDAPPADWPSTYSSGFVNAAMIAANLPAVSAVGDHSTQILMCGPPPMMRFACVPALKELGFTEDDWFRF